MKIKSKGIATESIILTFVQCFTYLASFIQVMILARSFTKVEYGTFSQGNLLVHFTAPLLLLGLSNATNYFLNQNADTSDVKIRKNINTIYVLIYGLGVIGGILIILFQNKIVAYFSNHQLFPIIYIFAFRPLFQNLISFFQVLYISSGMARIIAVRNTVLSLVQLIIVIIAAFCLKNVNLVCISLLITDIIQVVIFHYFYNKVIWVVKFVSPSYTCVKKIMKYAFPLALSTAVGTLSIHMDAMLIGRMMRTEDFAMYSNMAKELPFNLMISSFATIVYPKIVSLVAKGDREKILQTYKAYVELGILSTWILVSGAIVCGRELILILYSEKYIDGLPIFIIYQLVAALRFTYYGTLLTANGDTNSIFNISVFSLFCNFALNILLFYILGIIGPAIATFITVLLSGFLQIYKGVNLLTVKFSDVFDCKFICCFFVEICMTVIVVYKLKPYIEFIPTIIRVIVIGLLVIGLLFLINKNRLFYNINELNKQSL